jgi:hypothetical protein
MSVLIPAADRINADTAGLTHVTAQSAPGAPVMATPTEALAAVPGVSALDSLVAGGFHPESTPAIAAPSPVSVPIPTSSTLGRLGGLVPKFGGAVAPGNVPAAQRAIVGSVPSTLMIPGTPDQNASPPVVTSASAPTLKGAAGPVILGFQRVQAWLRGS